MAREKEIVDKIIQSRQTTKEKRKTQIFKAIELKIDIRHISKEKLEELSFYFVQAKWAKNDMLASDNIFSYKYNEHKTVTIYDKDKNPIEKELNLPSVYHKGVEDQVKQDIMNLSKAKKKGRKVGKLKFVKEVNSLPFRTGFFKIKSKRQVTIPGFKNLTVSGLDQLEKFENYDIANGWVIKKKSGFYIKIMIAIKPEKRETTCKTVGLDFGIKDSIVTSDGEKYNFVLEEDEQLKFLQRKLSKKQKGSKRYKRCLNQIGRCYERLVNKRDDYSNKLIAKLLKEYDVIYFQDENIKAWRKFNKGFAKRIQHSILGRIKSKLIFLEKTGRTYKIDKFLPTTKLCPQCGCINSGITLNDRTFNCSCGYSYDRDIHAAKNVKMLGSANRARWLEQPLVD